MRSIALRLALLIALFAPRALHAQPIVSRSAADCAALRTIPLPNTTIATAEAVSGTFITPMTRDTLRNLPAFCRVAGEIRPTSDSHIAFEVWLPLDTWNGNFMGVGNGGWAGDISFDGPPPGTLPTQVKLGYAVASTNTGHYGFVGDASFAYGHPERLVDFGTRAVHETTVAGKAIATAFYGRAPRHSFWIGCSTGGRQGLMEAQRFPADYDGIVAGAPVNWWVPLMTVEMTQIVATIGDSSRYLLPPARALLHAAAIKACDRLDGVADGVIEDPRRCHFDPATLQCPAASAPNASCLTAAQLAAAKQIYAGATDPVTGRSIAPGAEPGTEMMWSWFATPGQPFPIASTFYEWLVFGDSTWDWHTFDLTNPRVRQAWRNADAKYMPIIGAIDPNLDAFRARGGKLIQYHGWGDPLVTPGFSVNYYESVLKRAGPRADVQQFYRLFMVPGYGHCGGGDGRTDFDMEQAITSWVDNGVAPESVVATGGGRGTAPVVKRPLCPYPKVATYNGKGDTNDAANFACREP